VKNISKNMFWYIFLLKMCWESIKYLKMVWFLTKNIFWYIFLLKMCWKSIKYLKMVWILTGTIKKKHIPRPQHRHCIFFQFRVSLTLLIFIFWMTKNGFPWVWLRREHQESAPGVTSRCQLLKIMVLKKFSPAGS